MARYGGMGGMKFARQINQDDLFEMMVFRTIGDQMLEDEGLCFELWSALANVTWLHRNGDIADYSFRAAGDMIAAIRQDEGEMPYMNWYCRGETETISPRIEKAFTAEGWVYSRVSDAIEREPVTYPTTAPTTAAETEDFFARIERGETSILVEDDLIAVRKFISDERWDAQWAKDAMSLIPLNHLI